MAKGTHEVRLVLFFEVPVIGIWLALPFVLVYQDILVYKQNECFML